MKPELEQKLSERFTFYKPGESPAYPFFWGFECGDGWFKLLWELSEGLENAGFDGSILQVKEKYGSLRFYISGGDEVCEYLINEAETKSCYTCEICGRKGKIRDYGWFACLCFRHLFSLLWTKKMIWHYIITRIKFRIKKWTKRRSSNE